MTQKLNDQIEQADIWIKQVAQFLYPQLDSELLRESPDIIDDCRLLIQTLAVTQAERTSENLHRVEAHLERIGDQLCRIADAVSSR